MIVQNWWITTALKHNDGLCLPLKQNIECDILIVGGGMSGISAAAAFIGKGLKVVVLEKNVLGGSSSGRSAGFLTPDSELELSQLVRRYGLKKAREIWDIPTKGITKIKQNVERFGLSCDFRVQDSLFLGIGKSGWKDVKDEMESRHAVGFTNQQLYDRKTLSKLIQSEGYSGGVVYDDCYGINPFQYLQGMKKVLIENNIQVYESTEVKQIKDNVAYTHAGSVKAQTIICAIDKMQHSFNPVADEVFHAQTFLSISEPLNDKELHDLFPSGKEYQMWDNTLVYSYWRLVDGNRLLLGGGSALTSFAKHAHYKPDVISGVHQNFKKHFPYLKKIQFIQYWPGLIDTTRDLLPTIVRDKSNPNLHFILGVVGLPWASFCGNFLAENILGTAHTDDQKYFTYLSDRRYFALATYWEKILGKSILFSLNNLWAKYYQKDEKHQFGENDQDF
ncbi:MAG: FAD-binding oxidoreductase [Bacteroidetes bacterium]|nr:FAD-binding oxidoreductase [Bacteroidota bacterium]